MTPQEKGVVERVPYETNGSPSKSVGGPATRGNAVCAEVVTTVIVFEDEMKDEMKK